MRCRVVCGLAVTMLTFWPTSAFTSDDLPTLGRPTTATIPLRMDREFLQHSCRGGLLRAFARVGLAFGRLAAIGEPARHLELRAVRRAVRAPHLVHRDRAAA